MSYIWFFSNKFDLFWATTVFSDWANNKLLKSQADIFENLIGAKITNP
jgi:hypothetical protein